MGHLYHGYVSHNQRVPFLLLLGVPFFVGSWVKIILWSKWLQPMICLCFFHCHGFHGYENYEGVVHKTSVLISPWSPHQIQHRFQFFFPRNSKPLGFFRQPQIPQTFWKNRKNTWKFPHFEYVKSSVTSHGKLANWQSLSHNQRRQSTL